MRFNQNHQNQIRYNFWESLLLTPKLGQAVDSCLDLENDLDPDSCKVFVATIISISIPGSRFGGEIS